MMAQEVTRREAAGKLIETPLNLDLRLDRLMSFIGYYQDNHQGQTPTVDAMANELGTTHQTIRYWLGILESTGRIRRISQNPLRLMLKEGVRPIEMARQFDDNANQPTKKGWAPQIAALPQKKQERFEGAEGRRLKLARFIGEYWNSHGHAPSLIQIMDGMNSTSGAVIGAMLDALERRGFITRPNKARPYQAQLTDSGQIVVGLKKKEEVKVTQQTEKAPEEVRENRIARLRAGHEAWTDRAVAKRRQMHEWMADYQKRYGHLPWLSELAKRFGYTTVEGARKAILIMAEKDGLFELGAEGGYRGGRLLQTDLPAPKPTPAPVVVVNRPKKSGKLIIHSHIEQAKLVARAMMDHHVRWKEWPIAAELASAVGYRSGNGIRRATDWMSERGYVERVNGAHVRYALTERGREELLEEPVAAVLSNEEEKEDMNQHQSLSNREEIMRQALMPSDPVEQLRLENQSLRMRLAEALTANVEAAATQSMTTADMVLALIEAGYDVRRR